MSDPTLSDLVVENKMAWVWTTLNNTGLPLLIKFYQINASIYLKILISDQNSPKIASKIGY